MSELLTPRWRRRQGWVNVRVTEHERAGLTYGRAIEDAWADWRALAEAEKTQIVSQPGTALTEM
jgi:hypothetical protein